MSPDQPIWGSMWIIFNAEYYSPVYTNGNRHRFGEKWEDGALPLARKKNECLRKLSVINPPMNPV